MYRDLYEYLVLYRQLSLPGIGTLSVERTPAVTEFTHKQIAPASYTITWQENNAIPSKKLFNWLADRFNIPYHEAVVRFNGFAFDLKSTVMSGNKVEWTDVGSFSKSLAGQLKFEPAIKEHRFDRPVSAVRVIREKAVHTVRVGEEEKTSEEMAGWLNPPEKKKNYCLAAPLTLGVLALIATAVFFSQKGCNLSATASQQRLTPQKAGDTYTVLP